MNERGQTDVWVTTEKHRMKGEYQKERRGRKRKEEKHKLGEKSGGGKGKPK